MTRPSRSPAASAPLYLRPAALASGAEAAGMLAEGRALPLAGGPLAFSALEVIVREAAHEPAPPTLASIDELRTWAKEHDDETRAWIEDRLARLSRPRAAIRGLTFERSLIMGIVNVTPDSFSDGGDHGEPDAAIRHARALIEAGADILDIGGESTRPGAEPVPESEELDRVVPVIEGLRGEATPVCVDTRRARVMAAAVSAGAAMVNDTSALRSAESLRWAATSEVPVVLVHSRGEPRTMHEDADYDDVLLDVHDELEARIEACLAAGIEPGRLIVDPGIGFAKTATHNLRLLRGLATLHGLGCALMLGASRKSFIGRVSAGEAPKERLPGSLAVALWGLSQGAQILRVHDVAQTRQAIALWDAIARESGMSPEPSP